MYAQVEPSEEENIFLEYEFGGESGEILYSDLESYWSYANNDDVESYRFHVVDEKYILGHLTTAQGQGGIVFMWDMSQHKLVHVSEGSYVIATTILDGYIFALCMVKNFLTRAQFRMTSAPVEQMDAWKEVADIYGLDFSCVPEDLSEGTPETLGVKLEATYENGVAVWIDGVRYPVNRANSVE